MQFLQPDRIGALKKRFRTTEFRQRLQKALNPSGRRTDGLRQGIARQIDAWSDSIQGTVDASEPDFIDLGHRLQQIHERTRELVGRTIAAVETFGGREAADAPLPRLEKTVRQRREGLSCQSMETGEKLRLIQKNAAELKALNRQCTTIERIARFLRVIGINVAVESYRSVKSREKFTVVAQEIKTLAARIVEVSETLRSDTRAAEFRLNDAHRHIAAKRKGLDEVRADVNNAVEDAMHQIRHLMNDSLAVMNGARATAGILADQIGALVVGIQYHDNMRQRIGHAVEAMAETRKAIDGDAGAGNRDATDRLGRAHQVFRLQAGQLDAVIEGVTETRNSGARALGQITDEMSGLVGALKELADEDHDADAPLRVLDAALNRLSGLMSGCDAMLTEIRSIARTAGDSAIRINRHANDVRRIREESHIKALNAVIKAAHLGDEGRTFEVLAQEVKQLSDQAGVFVDGVRSHLEIMTGAAESHAGGPDACLMDAEAAKAGQNESAAVDISDTLARFRSAAAAIATDAEEIGAALSGAFKRLTFLDRLAQTLTGHRERLTALLALTSPWAKTAAAETGAAELENRYTMQKERDVHRQILEDDAVFDEPGGARSADDEAFDPDAGGAVFFLENTPGCETAPADGADDEFGDNVDLF